MKSVQREEIGRIRLARDVRIACGINRHGITLISQTSTTKEGRIHQRGVDDQRLPAIVVSDAKSDSTLVENHITAIDSDTLSIGFLIDRRLCLVDFAGSRFQDQIAIRVDCHSLDAIESESNDLRPRTRCDDKVIFKLPIISVIHDVNSRIDTGVPHARIGRQIGMPRIRSWTF